ncbi:MAG TPA: hypothetical protein DDW29_13660 [Gammaproteobacteria bacterium]|nr:hypothetical protein [Gammaproteobacteria bacterium]|tara:strand:- start:3482 stop:4075 length:594 start_codon:yes stop_codon:yes gene_type:complete
MNWSASPVNVNDVKDMQYSSESAGSYISNNPDINGDGVSLEEFTEYAKSEYNLDENTAELIFTRENMTENGKYDIGTLDEDQFVDVDDNLRAFKDTAEKYDLKGMDEDVAILLLGDKDGQTSPEEVEKLIDENYIEVDDGQMKFTAKGNDFFEWLDVSNSDTINSKDISEHLDDYSNDPSISLERRISLGSNSNLQF